MPIVRYAPARAVRTARFRYTDNRATMHSIAVGMDGVVEVVGDPENAAYEWVARGASGVLSHSDDAYGSPEVALRDGLIEVLGLPSHEVATA